MEFGPREKIHMTIPLTSPRVLTRTRIGALMGGICTIILRKCNYHAGGIYKQDP